MESFIDKVRTALASDDLDHIDVCGFASPDGSLRTNNRLARKRAESIATYIIDRTGVGRDQVNTRSGGVAWDELRYLVAARDDVPQRDLVLEILDDSTPVNGIDTRKHRLMALKGGRPYRWMLRNLFPKLRYTFALSIYRKSDNGDADTVYVAEDAYADSQTDIIAAADTVDVSVPATDDIETVIDTDEFVTPAEAVTDSTATVAETTTQPEALTTTITDPDVKPRHLLALKTNMLYYAILMPNLELEWLINDNWSVALEGNVAWWGSYEKLKSYRVAIIDAEARYWIKPREPWHGMYVGVIAGGGWYDLLNGGTGYYGDGGMAGLSLGYMWPIRHNLSLEAEVGAGYLYTRYKEYRPFEGHHLYLRTKELNYFGPLKVKLSIVWRFLDKNKLTRSNPAL
ncbi:MAG: DUF3575 domain-containing protein [Muribaculaceae bacterium]|nr:DUF3575 domain-containing protein [Muribaculaceae bacterium]